MRNNRYDCRVDLALATIETTDSRGQHEHSWACTSSHRVMAPHATASMWTRTQWRTATPLETTSPSCRWKRFLVS